MKRFRAAGLAVVLLATAACQDLTEIPLDFVAPENFFKNQADAVAAVNAAYAGFINLQSPFSSDHYVGRNFWMLVEYPTEYATSRLSATNERSLFGTFHTQFNASHQYIQFYWQAAYGGINRANAVIDRVPAVDMDETRRAQVVGEAKFIRALHYYWLAGMFGGVPLKLTETTLIGSDNIPRATATETWAQIAKDLTEAAAVLPVSWPGSDFGRATKGAALTLLGKAYLQSAATVPELKSANNQKAVDAFRQVTALGYGLAANYASLFDGTNERSNEIIFSFQNIRVDGAGGRITNWFGPFNNYWPGGAENQFQVERPFFDSYAVGDVRKDGTWLTSYVFNGQTIAWLYTTPSIATLYASTGPVPRKYLDIGSPDSGSDGIDYCILRYADVLLSLAEAINEVSGPTGEAYGYVNQVRARAGLPALTEGLSQPAFKDAVFLERKYELALEMHGVFDMRRHWAWAKARVEANMLLARTVALGGQAINTSPFTSSVEKFNATPIPDKWQLYPIPQQARNLNPLLTQNLGW